MNKDLEYYLEEISAQFPGQWENEASTVLKDWYAVSNEEGIIAYFGNEMDALRFRLDYINMKLNGSK